MKKLILTSALVMVVALGSSFEREKPKLSDKKKTEIAKKSNDKVYFWEVTTTDGTASGYTTSRRLAKKSIKQAAKGAIISSKIIESYETITTTK